MTEKALAAALPAYEIEQARRQGTALRSSTLLAAVLIVAFWPFDLVYAPAFASQLLAIRVVCGLILAGLSRASDGRKVTWIACLAIAATIVPIEAGALLTGGTTSPYPSWIPIVQLGAGLFVPLRPRPAIALQLAGLAIGFAPLLVLAAPGHGAQLFSLGFYLFAAALIAVGGALLAERLRRSEYRARLELARQTGLVNLGTLAGGLAHELANPLTHALIEAELLQPDPHVLALRASLKQMRDVLLAMKQGARLSSSEVRDVDLHREIDLALALVSHRIRNRIAVERERSDLPPVPCQPTLVAQVLVNLVLNAVDALQGTAAGRIAVRCKPENGDAVVEIEDNGPGVPAALRRRIFEPFFTTKGEAGNGLGLWIAAEIARLHGGELSLRQEDGRGACFRLALPLSGARASVASAPPPSDVPSGAEAPAPRPGLRS